MEYVNLGTSGLKVSRICLGMMTYGTPEWRPWVLDEETARPFVARALELGINFFDTADMYSLGVSEKVTGRALRDFAGNRDEVVVATKVYFPIGKGPNGGGLSRKHILESIDASLGRLGMEYVDLYQIHRFDPATPVEETMETLHDVVRAGKALYIGASSMYAWQFAKLQHAAEANGWTPFSSMQNHYNLVYREEEREMIPQCLDMGVGLIPWSPLARGLLTRPRPGGGGVASTRAETDTFAREMYNQPDDYEVVDHVVQVAEERGVRPAQVALAWLLQKPGVTAPIIGASKMHQLEEAAGALDVRLSDDEMRLLEEPYRPHRVLGHA